MTRAWYLGLLALLLVAMSVSLLLGYRQVSPLALLSWSQDAVLRHLILEYRLPRMLIAPLCGAALAVAGGLLQSLTRNPLAAPDVLGVNAAASCSVVLALYLWPDLALGWLNL
ncbi:MAG: iron chelate uptake ABC transporter family permease subunit, partial [Aeromonadaceae bacterium]